MVFELQKPNQSAQSERLALHRCPTEVTWHGIAFQNFSVQTLEATLRHQQPSDPIDRLNRDVVDTSNIVIWTGYYELALLDATPFVRDGTLPVAGF